MIRRHTGRAGSSRSPVESRRKKAFAAVTVSSDGDGETCPEGRGKLRGWLAVGLLESLAVTFLPYQRKISVGRDGALEHPRRQGRRRCIPPGAKDSKNTVARDKPYAGERR